MKTYPPYAISDFCDSFHTQYEKRRQKNDSEKIIVQRKIKRQSSRRRCLMRSIDQVEKEKKDRWAT